MLALEELIVREEATAGAVVLDVNPFVDFTYKIWMMSGLHYRAIAC